MKLRRSLIIPDTHRPYHSRRAYDVMLEVGAYVGVDEIVILGDYADFYSVSSHLRDPRLPHMLQKEIESVNDGLDELDILFPDAKKVFLEGNHEFRLERYLFEKAPALFGLTSCRDLFQIQLRPKWSYLDFEGTQGYAVLGSDLIARHTPLATNAETGLKRAMQSYIHGHTHRRSEVTAVGLDGKELVALCPGWLGDARSKAFSYMPSPPQWGLGFALVSSLGGLSSKEFHHESIHIKKDYSCVTQGKRFKI